MTVLFVREIVPTKLLRYVIVIVDVAAAPTIIPGGVLAEMEKPPVFIESVDVWKIVNPLRVLLLVIVTVYVPGGVVGLEITVRFAYPEPPDTVGEELYEAAIPAEDVAVGMVIPSFTKLLKLAFGLITTLTILLPAGWAIVTGLGFSMVE